MTDVPLTSREKQLLRRLAAAKSDGEIAAQIGGTIKQVSAQRARLLEKLKISTSAEIADAANQLANWSTYLGRGAR